MMNVNLQNAYGNSMPQGSINRGASFDTAKAYNAFGVNAASDPGKGRALEFGGCETCRRRKYVDGSNEANVSFKSPAHIDPASSASVVAGHEREHVANAVHKGSEPGAKLVSATVRLTTSICPECGRRYVSGGVTTTTIKYSSNPYSQELKSAIGNLMKGDKLDLQA